jgi:hypothetical protein
MCFASVVWGYQQGSPSRVRKSGCAKKPSAKYQESDMTGSQKRKKDQGGAVKGTKAKKNNGK